MLSYRFSGTRLLSRIRPTLLMLFVVSGLLAIFDSSTAKAQTPVSIVWKTKMKFGDVASDVDVAGSVIIDAVANSRSVTGGAVDFGGVWKRGKFQLLGDSKAYVIVTLPSSIVLQNGSGAFSITVNNIHMNLTNPIRLSKQGKKTIYIGGTVVVTVNQKNKTYNDIGTLTIDADYL